MEEQPALSDDPRLERCGFCKLYGPELEFYSKRYDIQIGRRSKSTKLDVVLGDNMNISRTHATIEYSFERGAWEMTALGKNGVTVQGTLYTPADGQPATGIALHSQDYIQIGDKSFYFLLPRSQARPAPALAAPAAKRPRVPLAC
ncbi:hypothetical protein WJX81_000241 [Elliptochloris bilobata]|uniref:FHA domain-containing protein n=1 Tax=Elliptochloris bilobata TaxID=381761 RepID=A0AAW1QY29_9CHLO